MTRCIQLISLMCLPLTMSVTARMDTLRAADEALWGSGGGTIAVVVGEVAEVTAVEEQAGEYSLEFEPIATIAGLFDASAKPSLQTRFWLAKNPGISSVRRLPEKGTLVMAVLFKRRDGNYVVASDWCDFMPGRSAMVAIDGLGDPTILETRRRIGAARSAHPDGAGDSRHQTSGSRG